MIEEHVAATGSQKGKMILESFEEYLPKFKKIMPHDYKKMLDLINEYNSKGLSYDQAEIVAFYNIKGDGSNGKDHRLLRV